MVLNYSTGNAKGVTYANLTKVSGNVPGTAKDAELVSNAKSILETTVAKTKHSVNVLKFPIDVDSDPGLGNHGHYIMFYINQQDHSKLSFGDPAESKQSGGDNMEKAKKEFNISEERNEPKPGPVKTGLATSTVNVPTRWNNPIGMQLSNQFITRDEDRTGVKRNSKKDVYGGTKRKTQVAKSTNGQAIHVKRAKTTRLKTAIAMYMPANVQVSYGANYTDTEMGSMVERAADVIQKFQEGNIEGGITDALGATDDLGKNVSQMLLGLAGGTPGFGGAKELEAMKAGRIISNRMELAFKGINKRSFQYTFKMIPRSAREAEEIKKIVHAFKFNMLPEFEGGDLQGRSFIVPNTFDIEYMYNGNRNQFLHKISTCVLESMNVTYGGDRYKTYTATSEGAPPVETSISLNFKEMEMITRERVEDGF